MIKILFLLCFINLITFGKLYSEEKNQSKDFVSIGKVTGLPIPRFVSLRGKKTNMRSGPSKSHPIKWQYYRHGLPVEVFGEFGNWRKIRDMDGSEGWIHQVVLSGRRSVVTLEGKNYLRKKPQYSSSIIAELKGGIVIKPVKCNKDWCYSEYNDYSGWIEKNKLYGVYYDEVFD